MVALDQCVGSEYQSTTNKLEQNPDNFAKESGIGNKKINRNGQKAFRVICTSKIIHGSKAV